MPACAVLLSKPAEKSINLVREGGSTLSLTHVEHSFTL